MAFPVPGEDRDTWGDKLRDWGLQEHNEDGSHTSEFVDAVRQGLASDADLDAHTADEANPHNVTKDQVGLANVDNTSDANKPISTDTQVALELKADDADLSSHTGNTANPHAVTKSQVGLSNVDNTSDANKPISVATQSALDAHTTNVANPHVVTKSQVGLGNADNTSDVNKPISTATQSALDAINFRPVTTKTANYTATGTDYIIRVDTTSGNVTITLPIAAVGKMFEITKVSADANDIIVDADSTDLIVGAGISATTITLDGQYTYVMLRCTTVNQWQVASAMGNVT